MGRRDDEHGAAAVEFALVLPLLLLLVFGIIEFGRIYSIQTSITAAARQGARVMALDNGPDPRGDASAAAISAASPYAISDVQVLVTSTPTATDALTMCPNPNTTSATVKVKVTYPVSLLTGWFDTSVTLHGTGVMRCNG